MMRRFPCCCLLAPLVLTLAPTGVFAHALGVDAKLRDGKVEVEAFYDDDSPAAKAKVMVLDAANKQIAAGLTDAKGRWVFASPPAGKYTVHVDAGAGHQAKKGIEVPGADTAPETPPPSNVSISAGPSRAELTSTPWL